MQNVESGAVSTGTDFSVAPGLSSKQWFLSVVSVSFMRPSQSPTQRWPRILSQPGYEWSSDRQGVPLRGSLSPSLSSGAYIC